MRVRNFYFSDETYAMLARLAEHRKTSMAGVLRDLVSCEFERLWGDLAENGPADAAGEPCAAERKEALG